MRVSTQAFFNNSISTLQRLQSDLTDLQEQIATGRRIQRPSDDPVGAARVLDYRQSIDAIDQFQRNTGLADSRLQLEEQTLTEFTNLLQRARELSLQAGNATQSQQTRGFIAKEIRQNVEEALSLANTRDAADEFLFSGFQTGTQPYTRVGDTFVYNGDQGQRYVQLSASRQIADSDPGDSIFGRIREGNGQILATADSANTGTGVIVNDTQSEVSGYAFESYAIEFVADDSFEVRDDSGALVTSGAFASGDSIAFNGISISIDGSPTAGDRFAIDPSPNTDVFSILTNLANALENGAETSTGRATTDNAVNRGLAGIDQALDSVLSARTKIGARLAVTESQLDTNAGTKLVLQSSLADIEDLDYAAAISALAQQSAALEAAQQSFVRVQSLSLFNFL
ncbi:MAG: flagellar hook-associated protein FlgL [Pseudomonadota bacterium]